MPTAITRPGPDEYAPYYARYIDRVPEGDLRNTLRSQLGTTLALLRATPESRGDHRYAPEKWTFKEVIGHVIDAERIFAYRALRIGRGDATPLAGWEQDDYVASGNFAQRTIANLAEELELVRRSTLMLFQHMTDAALSYRGTANGMPVTPRAIAHIIAGHELHHVEILKTRYMEGA